MTTSAPVSGYKFLVNIKQNVTNKVITLGFHRVSGLEQDVDLVEYREGNDPSTNGKFPGKTNYGPVTLDRGIAVGIYDLTQLAMDVSSPFFGLGSGGINPDGEESEVSQRFTVTITLYNHDGIAARQWILSRAWVRRVTWGDLQAMNSEIVMETVEICHEGLKTILPGITPLAKVNTP